MKREEELKKEIKRLSNNEYWGVIVTTMDLESGDSYEVHNKLFSLKDKREDFIKKMGWENVDGREDRYCVSRRHHKDLGSNELEVLQAELKGIQEERQRILKEIDDIDFKVRIQSEFNKYSKHKDMDWVRLAELKLKGEIKSKIEIK